MTKRYQYVKVISGTKRYFCIQQNPLALIWLLYFKNNTLQPMIVEKGLKKWSRKWFKSELLKSYNFHRNNIKRLKTFLICKYYVRDIKSIESAVEFPFYGQTCVLVNKGYKIFDFRKKIAIKIYRDDVDIPAIKDELERLKKGNQIDFAPSIQRWNIQERWYEETYINGSLDRSAEPMETPAMMKKFSRDVIPCLERLAIHQPPKVKNSADYVNEIRNRLVEGNVWREGSDIKKVDRIMEFIFSLTERFLSDGNTPFYLVLTHGDFCPANMLNTKKGLRVIDWESAECRSALFDFYSYFFFRPLHQKHPLEKSRSEINMALPDYISRIELLVPDISRSVKSHEKIYRWLFYIERMYILIEREKHDTKLNILDNMLRYIEVFNDYEGTTANHTEKLSCSNS